ncbi:hypothetical protein M422DRAFT_243259 [Sphaerobolus stellatus SS14]|nr:hypothetical protein M422DRAFT_243259 [Sphaerobolus stellatus SS14]
MSSIINRPVLWVRPDGNAKLRVTVTLAETTAEFQFTRKDDHWNSDSAHLNANQRDPVSIAPNPSQRFIILKQVKLVESLGVILFVTRSQRDASTVQIDVTEELRFAAKANAILINTFKFDSREELVISFQREDEVDSRTAFNRISKIDYLMAPQLLPVTTSKGPDLSNEVYDGVHKLPTEILAHIFVCCHAPFPYSQKALLADRTPENNIEHTGAPFALLLVSKLWASIARNTSELWNQIILKGSGIMNEKLLTFFLDRSSKRQKLDIMLLPEIQNNVIQITADAIVMLREEKHLRRVRSLVLYDSLAAELFLQFPPLTSPLPLSTLLVLEADALIRPIDAYWESETMQIPTFCNTLFKCPRLSSMVAPSVELALPEFAQFFLNATDLEECSIHFSNSSLNRTIKKDDGKKFVLPNLKYLRVTGTETGFSDHLDYLAEILSAVEVSNLRTLHVGMNGTDDNVPIGMPINMSNVLLQWSLYLNTQLLTLILVRIQMSEESLSELLKYARNLKTLIISFWSEPESLQVLNLQKYPELCLDLQHLDLCSSNIGIDLVGGILGSRGTSLQYLSLKDCIAVRNGKPRPGKQILDICYKYRKSKPECQLVIVTPFNGLFPFLDDGKKKGVVEEDGGRCAAE